MQQPWLYSTSMFLTSGYVLSVWVLFKSDFLHTFKRNFSLKKLDFLISIGLHVLRDFRLDVIRQHVLRNASFTVHTSSKLSSISAQRRLFLTALPNSSFNSSFRLMIALLHETAGSGSFPSFLLVKFGSFKTMFSLQQRRRTGLRNEDRKRETEFWLGATVARRHREFWQDAAGARHDSFPYDRTKKLSVMRLVVERSFFFFFFFFASIYFTRMAR